VDKQIHHLDLAKIVSILKLFIVTMQNCFKRCNLRI